MSTQQLPVYDDQYPRRVSVGAGTALKVGFFFAFGVTLFSIILWAIIAILTILFGAGLVPEIRRLVGGGG